jgi:general secretion pathway protein L
MLDASLSIWDAATGEWEQSRSFRFYRNIQKLYTEFMHHAKWSLARQALLGLVVLNLVGLNLWSWIEGVNIKSSEQELSKLLKETFPAIGLIVDPSLQMQREMKRLKHARGQSAAGDLESMLSAVAQQLPPNYRLQSFNYSANELRLNGVSKNLISGAGLNALEKAGYTLRAENTAVSGQMVPVLVMTFVDGSTSQN